MAKIVLREADIERQDDDETFCRSCNSPAEEGFEPFCFICGSYWKDCADGLWQDFDFREADR